MNTQEAANLATKEANPVIDGRKANVNLARSCINKLINSYELDMTEISLISKFKK